MLKRYAVATSMFVMLSASVGVQAQPGGDLVAVAGMHLGNTQMLVAHSGAAGDPIGYTIALPGLPTEEAGSVTCLHVSGNQAYMLVNGTFDYDRVLVHVVDNGPAGSETPDLIRNSFPGGYTSPTAGFPCGRPFFGPVPVETGDVIVVDGD
jgi:hypothetical protein